LEWGVPGTFSLNFTVVAFTNMDLQTQKSPKLATFWYKFAHKRKSWGPQKNLNIGAQLQNFLDAMA